MKLLIFTSLLFISSFHRIGESNEGSLEAQVIKNSNQTLIYIAVDNSENVDSLIIHTDIWRVALAQLEYTNECVFELNTAEEIVLRRDIINSYEIRRKGVSTFYNATDGEYIRKRLLLAVRPSK